MQNHMHDHRRDPARIDYILAEIAKLWKQHPDLRLGQMLVNAMQAQQANPKLFYVEDDRLLKLLYKHMGTAD